MKHSLIKNHKHFAFNIWDFESARAVMDAAASIKMDVILQTSTSIYKKIPGKIFAEFVKKYSAYKGIHAWLNIDHCKEKEMLFSAVDNGWDMIMVDGSSLPICHNIALTNEVATYAHEHGTLVEAEVGQVKGVEDDVIVRQNSIAAKEDIVKFLNETNVDFLAVAFGNAHGEYTVKPDLHFDLIEYTNAISNKPFVVHGGSGLSDEILIKLLNIKGVNKINISTDLKMAYKRGIEKANQYWTQPIAAVDCIHDEIMAMVVSKMKLIDFGGRTDERVGSKYGNEKYKEHYI